MTSSKKINNRPKIGLALSGASGRAMAHVGVLEVLEEHGIPIDYISACSSGTIIAASYACGTMKDLKAQILRFDRQSFLKLLELEESEKGVFSLERAEEFAKKFTLGKRFEDVKPRLNFVACDINTGEPVSLCLGDIARACRISCSVPFLFSPVNWGNRVLVDGGLFTLVPVNQVRELGADMVIGVDIAATRHMFKKRYISAWRGSKYMKKSFVFNFFDRIFALFNRVYESSIQVIFYNQSDILEEELEEKTPDLFAILGKAMDIAARQHMEDGLLDADVMISPNVKHMGKIELDKSEQIYREGRIAALEALPDIERQLKQFTWRKKMAV